MELKGQEFNVVHIKNDRESDTSCVSVAVQDKQWV